ncbi:nucleophile aminohydrolase [Leptodontidium sp. 2 PMI_412]|nr:nucleophile aminohydrolase [Leptodontidium sp. 2 PMI_412]
MHAAGLGSGGFALIRSPNGSYDFVDFRPSAPATAFETMFVNKEEALRGLEYLHKTYARLPWCQLFLPSIRLARDGFVVSQDLVNIFHQEDDASFLTDDPAWAIDFSPNGICVKASDAMTRKRADAFYTGKVAEATIATIRAANGKMSLEALRDYKIVRRKPLDITFHGFKITSCDALSSGSVMLNVMKTIEGYSDMCNPKSINMSSHHLTEAMRFGYGARTQLGDPSFIHNVTAFQLEMIKESTASNIRSKISDPSTLPIPAYNPAGIEVLETPGTSHVSTAGACGMAIALTSTVNLYFGSKMMVPEMGLIMNNLMNDFSTLGQTDVFGFVPSPANFIRLSDSSLYYVFGGVGGSHIITAIIKCLRNVLGRNMTVPEALLSPRFHDQLIPDETEFEPTFDSSTIAFMASRGHNITYSERQSDIEALKRLPNGTLEAGGDPSLLNSGGFPI